MAAKSEQRKLTVSGKRRSKAAAVRPKADLWSDEPVPGSNPADAKYAFHLKQGGSRI
jgi:hypothetical protein